MPFQGAFDSTTHAKVHDSPVTVGKGCAENSSICIDWPEIVGWNHKRVGLDGLNTNSK